MRLQKEFFNWQEKISYYSMVIDTTRENDYKFLDTMDGRVSSTSKTKNTQVGICDYYYNYKGRKKNEVKHTMV